MNDLYQTLGVPRSATGAHIKAAYRKLAKSLHPDRHPGDADAVERFMAVSAAHGILSDKAQRKRYDEGKIDADGREVRPKTPPPPKSAPPKSTAGKSSDPQTRRQESRPQGKKADPPKNSTARPEKSREPDTEFPDSGTSGSSFSTILSSVRKAGHRALGMSGDDESYEMTVDLLTALRGGSGRLSLSNGRTLNVNIPAGIEEGQQIRLRGQGEAGIAGAEGGDALVKISILPDHVFARDGRDVHIDLPITLREAILGTKINVPTIHGKVVVAIPKGSNSGDVLRLKDQGVKGKTGRFGRARSGDQFVTLTVMLPDKPDLELEELARKWSADDDYKVRDKLER